MEKSKVTDKRKAFEENDYATKKSTKKVKKTVVAKVKLCKKCKTEMDHVKTSGLLVVYKCPNCKFTIDQWV